MSGSRFVAIQVVVSSALLGILAFGQQAPPGGAAAQAPADSERERAGAAATEIVVPAGTTIPVVLNTFLNTRSTAVGDSFYADTTYPIWIQQRLVIPRGSIVKGSVTHVQRPGRIRGKGRLAVRFDSVLLPNGVLRELAADLRSLHGPGVERIDRQTENIEGGGSPGRDTGEIVGRAGEGAIIGAIAGRGAGAGIGAGAGAAVGLGTVLFSRGDDLVLGPGTQLDLVLRQPLHFPYGDLEFSRDALLAGDRGSWQRPVATPRPQDGRPRGWGRRGFPYPW